MSEDRKWTIGHVGDIRTENSWRKTPVWGAFIDFLGLSSDLMLKGRTKKEAEEKAQKVCDVLNEYGARC